MERIFVWEGWEDEWHAESATVAYTDLRILATGVQLGVDPLPYTLNYSLSIEPRDFVTRRLSVSARGASWSRGLELDHTLDGEWTISAESTGEVDLPDPGGDPGALGEARDVDLAFSPLTNYMPARRFPEGSHDFVMAFVEVPSLRVFADRQRYTHLRPGVVRYESVDGTFTADLQLDDDGFVVTYPQLARRLGG